VLLLLFLRVLKVGERNATAVHASNGCCLLVCLHFALPHTFFQGLCVRGCPSAMCQRSSFSKCAMSLCLNTLTCTQSFDQ
jgi:hypothetical protein